MSEQLVQAEHVLQALTDGVAVVAPDLHVVWANLTFEKWCKEPPVGRNLQEALGIAPSSSNSPAFYSTPNGKPVTTRVQTHRERYLDLDITPVFGPDSQICQLIAIARDVTAEVQKQQKLDALYQAGKQLAALSPDQLSEMSVDERVELLKHNIRRLTHDLLHYDVIDVRLRDRKTGRLEVLIQEGLTEEAASRVLDAEAEGQGITGHVAATGKSYLCRDTATDKRYLEGCKGGRSSLTVPLLVQDQVIGTFNVESPKPNAFGEDDVKFTEIFCRELASALNTLQLLSAENWSTATRSIDAVNRAVVLPVDEILASATAVLAQYIGHDEEMKQKLRRILASARAIKESIQKVGEDMAPAATAPREEQAGHPGLKGLRLLVVDNDERVRRSAHSILGRFGCVVETARDGEEALTMARLGTYGAMLADIRLPDLSGYEVYHGLREAQPQARVILMTAYGYDPSHSIVKAKQEGLQHVLYKPFRVDQLLDVLEQVDGAPVEVARCGA